MEEQGEEAKKGGFGMTRLLLAIVLYLGVMSAKVIIRTNDRVSAQRYVRGTASMILIGGRADNQDREDVPAQSINLENGGTK